MATTADIDIVRDYVGTDDPSDGDISALVDALGSPLLAAQRILSRRKADLEATEPFSVTGFTQGSVAANLASIERTLDRLAVETGSDIGGAGVTAGLLVRPERTCRR